MLSSSAPSHHPSPLQTGGHHQQHYDPRHHRSPSSGSSSATPGSTQIGTPGRASSMMSSPGSPQSAGSNKNYCPWENYSTHEEPEEYYDGYFHDHASGSSPIAPSRSGTTSTTSPLLIRGRTASESSASPAAAGHGHGQNNKAANTHRSQNKKVNAHSYCGRHSSEFLFGGRGLGDLWRAVHPPKNGKKE